MTAKNDENGKLAAEIDFTWGVKILMRDGVSLNGTLYKPKDPKPVPAIFTLTPYIADSYHARGYYFAQHGYAFVLVDCRGRGNSGGRFTPFLNESRDGHDIVEWLGIQDWCDGQVTMWGGSYGGFDQWMTLKEFPSHLKTVVPVASAYAAVDFPFFKNIFFPYEVRWQTLVSGVTGNPALFEEDRFWVDKCLEWTRSGRAFREFDQIVGNPLPVFQDWVDHPTPDAYWQEMWITADEYERIDMPILSITGHYDGDQPGAMTYYRQHMQHGSEPGKAQHYLIIGPWDHAGTRTPNREFGGLKFTEAMMLDMNRLHQEWYDWTLKGGEKPEFLKDRVAYYVMGAEKWKYAPDLDSITEKYRRYYLDSISGEANDVFHSGMLVDELVGSTPPDQYVYDPLDLRSVEFEKEHIKDYLTDQRRYLHLYGAGLIYHSQPFEVEVEISGCVRLVAWMAIDQPDTDFNAVLAEVLPNGSTILLSEDLLRARYRESPFEARLVAPGNIERYEFDGFTFFSRQIAKGSRLRLVIRAPNSIHLERNYNSGRVVSEETAADAHIVRVNLYHDAEYQSYMEIPIGKDDG